MARLDQLVEASVGRPDTWRRGRGLAISQAVGLVPYYVTTNPALSALGQRMLREILVDVPESLMLRISGQAVSLSR